ncbi:cytochrome P450 CYP72A219-like [Vitis riparia]|uniref:cytochrome P450 CYP72A219-like n=1 Tax=Vitis riparia TaxID=96939 RepID=UPI00155A27EE|nr:cytochrome P450 CYP72A219-like [Vitis riparia]
MEGLTSKAMAFSFAILVVYGLLRAVYTIWWRPKSLEKQLRQQGIRGTRYKPMYGDMKALKLSFQEAQSKPMTLNHSIAPRVIPFFHQMFQNYGKISMSWIFTRPRVMIVDPELIRMILADKNGQFQKPPLSPLVDLLTLGLSTLEGERWAKRRKLLTPAFHVEKLMGMVPAFSMSCCNLIERWKNWVGPQGTYELDVMPEFQNVTGDVISRAAFGSSYEEGKKVFELQKEQAVLVIEASRAIYLPGIRFVPTVKNRRRYHIDNEIKAMLRSMIHRKKQAMKNGDSGYNDDLLGLLLQLTEEIDNEMRIEDLIEECKLFYFAGQETTANLLTWTMILLSMNPKWQDKAREEVLQICGKKIPDLEAIKHLKIVSMILHEVLRLYPSVVNLLRYTHKRTDIAGLSIPAGVELYLPTILLHHSPEYWGDDVEEFKPERFSEGVSKASKGDQIAFYPFGWGPRICLGQSFAMIEAKMALAMILQNFWFELSPTYTHAPYTVITLQPQYGAPIMLHQI